MLFVVAGLSDAAYLFIGAAGLSLVFGALRVINMAHGSLYMIGAYLATVVVSAVAAHSIGFWAAVIVAPAAAALIGAAIEIVVLRRVYGGEHLLQLLGTYAVTLVAAGVVRIVFGPQFRTLTAPAGVDGSVQIGGEKYAVYSFFLIGAAIALAGGLWLLMNRTPLGRNIRAAISDGELLDATGVNVSRLYTIVFMIGAALAGLSGVLVAPSQSVNTGMDADVLIYAFAISVIGGLGSLIGSFVGSIVVGLIIGFGLSNQFTSKWAIAFIFAVMVVVLTIRPYGLFGRAEQ